MNPPDQPTPYAGTPEWPKPFAGTPTLTPRTDAAVTTTIAAGHNTVCPNFARTLERELSATERLRFGADADRRQLRCELAAAKTECERLRAQVSEFQPYREKQQQREASDELEIDKLNAELAHLRTEVERMNAASKWHESNDEACSSDADVVRLRAELCVAENWVDHHSEHADDLIAENVKLRAEVERLKSARWKFADDPEQIFTEDHGWLHVIVKADIDEMEARAERAEAECLEQARLLGMSGEREADLLGKLFRLRSIIERASVKFFHQGTDGEIATSMIVILREAK